MRLGVLTALIAGSALGPVAAQQAVIPAPPPISDAPIAMLVDISNGQVLHSHNADRRFVPASITKVMTLYLAFELIDQGQLDPSQVMVMSPAMARDWRRKGSTMFLTEGARVQVDDLLAGIANVSANDGSAVLAEGQAGSIARWTATMNAKAREIGMKDSHFATPNGWPDEGRTFTTARDLVMLARAMVERHPQMFAHYVGRRQFEYQGIRQSNYDPLIGRMQGADGIKTGFTNEAGFGFLGTARRGDQRLVMVIGGVSRGSLRARLARNYMEWGFSAFDRKPLFAKGEVVGRAKVQGGSARSIDLIADRAVHANVSRAFSSAITATIVYDGPLRAPIMEGKTVAMLKLSAPGMIPAEVPLVAGESIGEANMLARTFNGFARWLN